MSAVFPGTFDPFTNGHLDIAERAASVFGGLRVAVVDSPHVKTFFDLDARVMQVKESCSHIPSIEVAAFSGLLVDYLQSHSENVIVRGLRAVSDYEYEIQMALMNKSLASDIETCFLAAREVNSFISSSMVKSAWLAGADVNHLVPEVVAKDLARLRLTED